MKPLTKLEWKRLETMHGKDTRANTIPAVWEILESYLARTQNEDCHPDWYNGPCLCAECRSYGE